MIKNKRIPHPKNKEPDYGTFLNFDEEGRYNIVIDQTKYQGPFMIMSFNQWMNLLNLDRKKPYTREGLFAEFGVELAE